MALTLLQQKQDRHTRDNLDELFQATALAAAVILDIRASAGGCAALR